MGCATTSSHNVAVGSLSREKQYWWHCNYALKLVINKVSTIKSLPCSKINGLCNNIFPQSYHWPPLYPSIHVSTTLLCPTMSVNGVSTISYVASVIIQVQWSAAIPQSTYPQPVWAKILVMILHLPPTIECPSSVNHSCGGSASYHGMKCIDVFLNCALRSQSVQYVAVFNLTNMHTMSDRYDFFWF